MSLGRSVITSISSVRRQFPVALAVLFCVAPLVGQKAQPDPAPPKYDSQTEMKTKGTVEEIKIISLGARKDYTELILKNGPDTLQIYISPKPFQDEMGINFTKGEEIAVTGSKIKQEESEVILAREIVRGTDTLMFRDDKGKPIWNERTGK